MLKTLKNSLVVNILEYLRVEDIVAVLKSCKHFKNLILENEGLWMKECFRKYLSFDLEAFRYLRIILK
jgi:hypothetical protein